MCVLDVNVDVDKVLDVDHIYTLECINWMWINY